MSHVQTSTNTLDKNVDWSFANVARPETLWGPHGYHRYPAKFIPQLVRQIIEDYSRPGDLVGDIFLGSGTTGLEAMRTGRRFYGSDINPVGLLISRVKSRPIDPKLLATATKTLLDHVDSIEGIARRPLTKSEKDYITSFDLRRCDWSERYNYWFPKQHRLVLEQILAEVLTISDLPLREFFLCAFSNILRRCSIWLSGSTKPQKDLKKSLPNPVSEFGKQVRSMVKRNRLYWNDLQAHDIEASQVMETCQIEYQDARALSLKDGSFDLLVTSPPYATCYDYSHLHQLTQLWFERFDIFQRREEIAWIGSDQTQIRLESDDYDEHTTGSQIADDVLNNLLNDVGNETSGYVQREARLLRYYFQDMSNVMTEMERVIAPGKKLALVIGDTYKCGVVVPTVDALQQMAEQRNFQLIRRIPRTIPGRVLVMQRDQATGRFSSTADADTQAYPEEYILVFERS
jgi:DNA modification methylase